MTPFSGSHADCVGEDVTLLCPPPATERVCGYDVDFAKVCCRCEEPKVPPKSPPEHGGSEGDEGDDGDRNWMLPAIVAGVAALAAVNHHLKKEKEQDRGDDAEGKEQLLRDGPQLPHQFNMSAFGIRGLIKGGWPIVVDYEQTLPGKVQLKIAVPGVQMVTYRLDQFGLGRHVLRFDLPPFLGNAVKPAIVALTASDEKDPDETLEGFKVFGVGIGPRAVGSVAVDQLEFHPGTVRPQQGDDAAYAFHSLSDFDNAAVEFMRVSQSPDGIRSRYVHGRRISGGITRNAWIGRDAASRWNGHDERDRVSKGRHRLQVRVWDDGGDWVGAWSDSVVTVR
ncbi:MAG: hypothetical protein ABFS23_01665 [Pseudomonadota bacterium]